MTFSGFMAGRKFADARDSTRAMQEELDRLETQLQQTLNAGLQHQAVARAASEIAKEVVKELAAEEAGQSNARRLSDPANRRLRNQELADRAAKAMDAISRGEASMSAGDKAALANANRLK